MTILSKAIIFWIFYSLILSTAVGWALTIFPLQTGKPIHFDALLHAPEVKE